VSVILRGFRDHGPALSGLVLVVGVVEIYLNTQDVRRRNDAVVPADL